MQSQPEALGREPQPKLTVPPDWQPGPASERKAEIKANLLAGESEAPEVTAALLAAVALDIGLPESEVVRLGLLPFTWRPKEPGGPRRLTHKDLEKAISVIGAEFDRIERRSERRLRTYKRIVGRHIAMRCRSINGTAVQIGRERRGSTARTRGSRRITGSARASSDDPGGGSGDPPPRGGCREVGRRRFLAPRTAWGAS